MTIKRIRRKPRVDNALDAERIALLLDRPPAANRFLMIGWNANRHGIREALWNEHADAVLAEWVRANPGCRPSTWWAFAAPRAPAGIWPGCYYDGKLAAPRKRLGGKGTPKFEVLAYVPTYERGVPDSWVSDWEIAYYTGRAKDVHGERIGAEYAGCEFAAERFDPADPPVFESEAAYLRRFKLFLPGERSRLTRADFAPEPLPRRLWPLERKGVDDDGK